MVRCVTSIIIIKVLMIIIITETYAIKDIAFQLLQIYRHHSNTTSRSDMSTGLIDISCNPEPDCVIGL